MADPWRTHAVYHHPWFAAALAAGGTARPAAGYDRPEPIAPMHADTATAAPTTLLIVDDEPELRGLLAEYFGRHGFAVQSAASAAEARALVAQQRPALALLDVHMPGENGLGLARWLREAHAGVAIVMLTTASEPVDRIVGLELGADDYLPKPFEPRELAARLATILRRARAPAGSVLRFDGLSIDTVRREVRRGDEPVDLTGTEFELLLLLAREPNKVFSRDEILNRLHGRESLELHTRAVDILVSRVRRKLEPLAFIKTLRNAGYTFAGARL